MTSDGWTSFLDTYSIGISSINISNDFEVCNIYFGLKQITRATANDIERVFSGLKDEYKIKIE